MSKSGDEGWISRSPNERRRPRVLFVTQHLPIPVRGGSSQRTNLLVEGLSKFADVDLLPFGWPAVKPFLEGHGYRVVGVLPPERDGMIGKASRLFGMLFPRLIRYRPRRDAATMVRRLWETGAYDAVIGRYCRPSARAGIHLLPRSIIDIDDIESQKLSSWAKQHRLAGPARGAVRLIMARMQQAERRVIAPLAAAWLSASDDLAGLPAGRTDVIPNIPFYPVTALGPSPSNGVVLFVASLDYRVNVDALTRLVDHVWPRILAKNPALRLRVVGGGLDRAEQQRMARPGVELVGFVDDLTAEYAGAMCSIVPIWEGGGTKIKILESLALGRTCVVAEPSMRGYADHLRDNEDLIIAADEDALTTGILALAANAPLRHRLELHGRDTVNAFYSREMLTARLRDSFERVIGSAR